MTSWRGRLVPPQGTMMRNRTSFMDLFYGPSRRDDMVPPQGTMGDLWSLQKGRAVPPQGTITALIHRLMVPPGGTPLDIASRDGRPEGIR